MTPHHHPSEELIGAYAAGALRPGAALVVRAHLGACAHCRSEVGLFESLGGALIEAQPEAALTSDALQRALAAIERPEPQPRSSRTAPSEAAALSPALEGRALGRRRWLAPGVWMSPVESDPRSDERVYLLRVGAGMAVPRHSHKGREFTCVLEGSFSDSAGRYEAGDFVSADDIVEHKPVVSADGACICLIATEAPLVMRGLVGRLLQPFGGV